MLRWCFSEANILKLEQLAGHMIHCGRTNSREPIFRALLNLQSCHRPPDCVTTTPSLPFNSEAFTGSQIPLNFFHTWGSFYVKCDYITISNLTSSLSRLYVHHIECLDIWCIFFYVFYCYFCKICLLSMAVNNQAERWVLPKAVWNLQMCLFIYLVIFLKIGPEHRKCPPLQFSKWLALDTVFKMSSPQWKKSEIYKRVCVFMIALSLFMRVFTQGLAGKKGGRGPVGAPGGEVSIA